MKTIAEKSTRLAQVVIADATAPWPSNVTLSVVGKSPINRSLALPLEVFFLAESDAAVAADLERLADLMPGLVAEVCVFMFSVCVKVGNERSASKMRSAISRTYEDTVLVEIRSGSLVVRCLTWSVLQSKRVPTFLGGSRGDATRTVYRRRWRCCE